MSAESISRATSSWLSTVGRLSGRLGVRRVFHGPGPFEDGHEEEAQRRQPYGDGGGLQLAHAEQVDLVVADVVEAELVGRAAEMSGELLDRKQVSGSCSPGSNYDARVHRASFLRKRVIGTGISYDPHDNPIQHRLVRPRTRVASAARAASFMWGLWETDPSSSTAPGRPCHSKRLVSGPLAQVFGTINQSLTVPINGGQRARLPRFHGKGILKMNARIAAALLLSIAASSGFSYAAASPEEAGPASGLTISVDPRIELLATVQLLRRLQRLPGQDRFLHNWISRTGAPSKRTSRLLRTMRRSPCFPK